MSSHGKRGFPLPEVARSLSPYISTRQEALQIRRTLTVYLTTLLNDKDTANRSALSLTIPALDIQLAEIPPEVSGVFKEYLEETQAHVIARREYCAVALQTRHHPASNSYIGPSSQQTPIVDASESSATNIYLALLRQRKRYARLRILRDYMDILLTKPAAKAGHLEIARTQLDAIPGLPLPQPPVSVAPSVSLNETLDELVLRLEKAVLRAKHKLEIEQELFMKIKERQHSGCGTDSPERCTPSDRESRCHALHQTRQELINWVEQELAKTDATPTTPQHVGGTAPKPRPATGDTEQCNRDIERHYGGYVEARKICLATVAEAASSMPLGISESCSSTTSNLPERSRTVGGACCSGLLDSYMRLLVPSNLQRLITQQKAYIESSLAMEEEATVHVLDRLADESHLLPEYPLLARDSRFQNITAALGSKTSHLQSGITSEGRAQTKALEMASRWAFAANAAKASAQEGLEQKIAQGTNHMSNAREILSEVRNLLGQQSQLAVIAKAPVFDDEDEDTGAPSASSRARKGDRTRKVDNRCIPQSIWCGLQGDLR